MSHSQCRSSFRSANEKASKSNQRGHPPSDGAVAAPLQFGKSPQAVVESTKVDLDRMIDFDQSCNDSLTHRSLFIAVVGHFMPSGSARLTAARAIRRDWSIPPRFGVGDTERGFKICNITASLGTIGSSDF